MIYLIHGQNQVDSRRFLVRLKNNYQNIESISGKNLTEEEFKRISLRLSHPLFGGKSSILIENFNGDWQILPKAPPKEVDIILWSGEKIELGKVAAKNFLFHKTTKASVFKLADAVLFKREKEALVLTFQLLSTKEANEKIIGALGRGLYLAYCAKEGSLAGSGLPNFAREKIEDQAKFWSGSALKKALIYLLQSDLALKRGAKAHPVFTSFISRSISS